MLDYHRRQDSKFSLRILVRILVFSSLLLIAVTLAAQAPTSSPIGSWEGESVCQVPKPCTTEHVIYEIKPGAGGQFTIAADKVVNGERLSMGTLTCKWSASEKKLACPLDEARTPGDWVFTLDGDTLTGTLTVRDGNKLFRKVSAHRQK